MRSRFPKYERLLKCYPARYRKEYGGAMLQTLADMLDDQPTKAGKLRIWLRASIDLPASVAHQNIIALGDTFMHQTPQYIKRNGVIAGTLLIPFIAALTANGLDKVINNHTLYNSWVWGRLALTTWVIVLPALAFLLAFASYMLFVAKQSKANIFSRLFDLRRVWPVAITGVIGLGILFMVCFHDSVHCWMQNPVHVVTQWHQTWSCVEQGSLFGS